MRNITSGKPRSASLPLSDKSCVKPLFVLFHETAHQVGELFRFFQIHQVAHSADHHPPRSILFAAGAAALWHANAIERCATFLCAIGSPAYRSCSMCGARITRVVFAVSFPGVLVRYKTCAPSGLIRQMSFPSMPNANISADVSSIRCRKMFRLPVRFDMNMTALLSAVQSNGMSSASSIVRRRGVLAFAVLQKTRKHNIRLRIHSVKR